MTDCMDLGTTLEHAASNQLLYTKRQLHIPSSRLCLHMSYTCLIEFVHHKELPRSRGAYFPLFTQSVYLYRILPIKGASPNEGAPYSLKKVNTAINHQRNRHVQHAQGLQVSLRAPCFLAISLLVIE